MRNLDIASHLAEVIDAYNGYGDYENSNLPDETTNSEPQPAGIANQSLEGDPVEAPVPQDKLVSQEELDAIGSLYAIYFSLKYFHWVTSWSNHMHELSEDVTNSLLEFIDRYVESCLSPECSGQDNMVSVKTFPMPAFIGSVLAKLSEPVDENGMFNITPYLTKINYVLTKLYNELGRMEENASRLAKEDIITEFIDTFNRLAYLSTKS